MESVTSGKWKWWVAAALFALCVAPTFISYLPYRFGWDDSDYLQHSIAVSRAFWSGDKHGLRVAMVSNRLPAMELLGLPWGRMTSWEAASKCFITLAAETSLLAALSLYLLLRSGVKPFFLVVASVCVVASMGPYPPGSFVHAKATNFMVDSLFAWTALAALLLIPYEARVHCLSVRGAVLRGILWGSILSFGAITKMNFLYFVVLIVPVLFFLKFHHEGLRGALAALIACGCCLAPSALYLLRWGHDAFYLAKISSFGWLASFYQVPLLQFVGHAVRGSPGLALSCTLTAATLLYLAIKGRLMQSLPDFLALMIIIGFGIIVLSSPNRDIRFEFPVIVALPFLTAVLMSGNGQSVPGPFARLAAGLAFCVLLVASIPTGHRADRQFLSRPDAVLALSFRCNAKHIVLATDSPTLNTNLMALAREFSESGASFSSLVNGAIEGVPIEEQFRTINESDYVVFQDGDALSPPFKNQRAPEYERYVRQSGFVPIRVGDDISVYSVSCRP